MSPTLRQMISPNTVVRSTKNSDAITNVFALPIFCLISLSTWPSACSMHPKYLKECFESTLDLSECLCNNSICHQIEKNDNFGSPIFRHFRDFCRFFSGFFSTQGSGRLRERPGRPQGPAPGPPRDRFFNDFGSIFGSIFGTCFSWRLLFFVIFFVNFDRFPDGYSTQARNRNTD